MKYCDYKIVESMDVECVERTVKRLMLAGWVPLGGVWAMRQTKLHISIGQAMGLPVQEEVNDA
ncbi:MAG: hypothetical protein M0P69_17910 [Bacteroidales bacterium]|nr:hypothetical protein [Bacteroidales bacterium]